MQALMAPAQKICTPVTIIFTLFEFALKVKKAYERRYGRKRALHSMATSSTAPMSSRSGISSATSKSMRKPSSDTTELTKRNSTATAVTVSLLICDVSWRKKCWLDQFKIYMHDIRPTVVCFPIIFLFVIGKILISMAWNIYYSLHHVYWRKEFLFFS